MIRKSNALTVLLAALVLLATVTSGVALGDASVGGDENDDETDGEQSVYLVFGADVESGTLDQWVEEFKNGHTAQSAESTVVQYQDVDQLNVNQQEDAVAISMGNSTARAIQQTQQTNENEQIAVAQAQNQLVEADGTTLRNVRQVNVIFADGGENASGYTGMVVRDESNGETSSQFADADVVQSQNVDQLNYNNQSSAIAIADENSAASAFQETYQENVNQQVARANASNVAVGSSGGDQGADADVEQTQVVNQTNVNLQGTAVAIAADNSTAVAVQTSYQRNANSQIGVASASNLQVGALLDSPASSMATASSGAGDAAAGAENDSKGGDPHEPTATESSRYDDGRTKLATQSSVAKVKQHQEVSQRNVNNQNMAFAFAVNNSTATAYQSSEQYNENAQLASATSTNIHSQMTSVVMSGDRMTDRPDWAVEYDGAGSTSNQRAWSHLEQTQLISQLNFNQQSAAVAIAIDEGDSSTFQVNFQRNENVQEAVVEAINECGGDCGSAADANGGDATDADAQSDDKDGQKEDSDSSADDDSTDSSTADSKTGSSTDDSTDSPSADDNTDSSSNESNASEDTGGDESSSTDDETDGEASSDGNEDSDDSLPGFGVGIAALSLLGAGLLSRRRS